MLFNERTSETAMQDTYDDHRSAWPQTPGHGQVREIFELEDKLLLVATDRSERL